MKSSALGMAHQVLSLVASVGALHVGLSALGFNMLGLPFIASFAKPLMYVFGFAGAFTLAMCIMCFINSECTCGSSC